jgi:ABC-2 type transport system ATP-binding protein
VLEIRDLTVRYGSFTALNNFSVSHGGGAVGLLGPNGAGKTTLLKAMLGFIKPTAGSGSVLGLDMATQGPEIRQLIGYMPEQDCHIPGMSAVEFVAYAGQLSGLPENHALQRAHEVLEYAGLGEARYRYVETFSTGMKQRAKFAQALVHGPRLLLLDEPTNGLDPRGREEMLELIRDVSHRQQISVLVSSHLLPDIERTCDDVIVVMGGELRAAGSIESLKSIAGKPVDVELREDNLDFFNHMIKEGYSLMPPHHNVVRVQGPGTPYETISAVFAGALATGAQVRRCQPAERSLEEAFLEAIDA